MAESVTNTEAERFLTIRLYGKGVVERAIGAGKTPRPFSGYRVAANQFIYSRIDARNGAFGIVPALLAGAVVSKDFPVFDVDRTRVDTRYLVHLVTTESFYRRIRALSFGATNRQRVAEPELLRLPIPLPSIEEQRRIADILDRADALRTKRREALKLLEDLTQSIFLDMFGAPLENPKRFPVKVLADLGSIERGVSKHRPRNDPSLLGGAYPLIQTGDVAKSGGRLRSFASTYSDLGLAQSKLWPAGTLCITIAANIAKTAILDFSACFPDSVVGFTADQPTTLYVREWLGFMQQTLEAAAPMSAQRNINLALLRSLPIPVPPVSSLALFSERVTAVESEQAQVVRGRARTEVLFTSLQEQAFAGSL